MPGFKLPLNWLELTYISYNFLSSDPQPKPVLGHCGERRDYMGTADQASLPEQLRAGGLSSGMPGGVKVHFVTGYCYKENPQIVPKDKDLVDH